MTPSLFAPLKFNAQGLVPVTVLDVSTHRPLMQAWANQQALELTHQTQCATFFSRSRNALWKKGESSGHVQHVESIWTDCDFDSVLYLATPDLPVCHTGTATCFFRKLSPDGFQTAAPLGSASALAALETVIRERADGPSGEKPSYTRQLLEKGLSKQTEKLTEESGELVEALHQESDARVVSETADVLYHLLVALRGRKIDFSQVEDELRRRFGVSGIEEKARRRPPAS